MPAQPLDARSGAARRLPGCPGGGRQPRAQQGAARDAQLSGGPIRGGEGGEEFLRALAQRKGTAAEEQPGFRAGVRSAPAGGSCHLAQFGGRSGSAEGGLAWSAAAAYAADIGREVGVDDIQLVVNELLAANVLMSLGGCQER